MSRPDTSLHPAILGKMLRSRDIAYGCYLYLGSMLGLAFVMNRLPTSWLIHHWVGAVLGLPVIMAGLIVAGLVGVAYSFRARDDTRLVLLTGMTTCLPIVLVIVSGPPDGAAWKAWAGALFFGCFTALTGALPLWWFVHDRRAWRHAAREQGTSGACQP